MRTWTRLLATSLSLGTLGAAACGDDGGGGGPDAANPDANIPDSGPPVATRSATIAVTDVALTSEDGAAQGWRGGSISIVFEDITTGGGEVVYGTSPVGGCVVTRYDATHPPHDLVGAGGVVVSGNGLLKPVGACGDAGGSYTCVSDLDGNQDVTVSPLGLGVALYTFPEKDFSGSDYVGSYLSVNGLTNDGNNSGASAFPITAQPSATQFAVLNPAATAEGTPSGTGSYALINGAGPIPTAGGADADFLGDATTSVEITKDADAEWGAIDFTTYVRGEGFDLDDASAAPHEFPATAAALSFSCSGAGGDCGADGNGALEAFIVSGETTDADLTGVPLDFIMPPPVNEWATFQCGFLLADSGSIPLEAVQAILDTNPSRIETRILRVAGAQPTDPANALNTGTILVGHGIVGHTTLPQ